MKTSCEAAHPQGHCRCTRELGHAGDHQHATSESTWPRTSERVELEQEDAELGALRACVRNLDGLLYEEAERVIGYLQTRFLKGSSRS